VLHRETFIGEGI